MKLEMKITVQDDEGRASRTAVNGLTVATTLAGMDRSEATSDFLAQVDSLVRMVVGSQVPALYEQVLQDVAAGEKTRETVTGRARKKEAQEKPARNGVDPVEDGVPYGAQGEEDGQ